MAMLDYGCIVKKNNKFINESYLGDNKLSIEIYKTVIIIRENNKIIKRIYGMNDNILPYKKYRLKFEVKDIKFDIKRLGQAQFKLKFNYNNDKYVCVYGYAVGEDVYNWWKNGLGLTKKECQYCLKWCKHVK